jgi:2,4-dienoyl-CoA reductase-like NADH-dependent reductase (Old Yellow Enzyme family)
VTELDTAGDSLTRTLLDGADVTPLFSPVTVAGLALRNRLVMAPMTRQFSPGGIPADDVAAYYGRRAAWPTRSTRPAGLSSRSCGTPG